MTRTVEDRQVVDAFVAHLREHGHPGLAVERRPDDENSASSDIDAVAGPFAIEHTSVDVLPLQRREEAWFKKLVGDLAREVPAPTEGRLRVSLEYGAVRQGQNWAVIRRGLKSWLSQSGLSLAAGTYVFDSVPGVPFRLHVRRSRGKAATVSVGLLLPEDNTLAQRLQEQLGRKAAKLAPYQPSKTTVLLIESGDIQLMNEAVLLSAIAQAFPEGRLTGVDQVWYADTSIPTFLEFVEFTDELRQKG